MTATQDLFREGFLRKPPFFNGSFYKLENLADTKKLHWSLGELLHCRRLTFSPTLILKHRPKHDLTRGRGRQTLAGDSFSIESCLFPPRQPL